MKWHRIAGLLWKSWYITINRLDRIFDIFYWPLTGLLIWGFTTYWIRDLAGTNFVVGVFIGGIVLWTFFIRASQDIAVYVLEDFWSHNLVNVFASPITALELIVSNIILGVWRSVLSFIFLIFLAYLLYSFNLISIGIVAVSLFSLGLLLFGWVLGVFVAGLIFRYGMRIQIFAWSITWLIQPFSAVFYPLSSVPVWVQKISLLVPTTYIFEGMREALATGNIAWTNLGYSFLMNIVLLVLAFWFFCRSVNKAKRTGLLTRSSGD